MNREKLYSETKKSYMDRQSYIHRFVDCRFRWEDEYYNQKKKVLLELTDDEKETIHDYWSKVLPERTELLDYRMFEAYKAFEENPDNLKFYVPDGFWYAIIDEYFTNPQRSQPIDDKNLYDLLFHDVNRPKTLFRKIGNTFYDADYKTIPFSEVIEKAECQKELIIKSSFGSYGGHGVKFWNIEKDGVDGLLLATQDHLNLANTKNSARREIQIVAQDVIKQHECMSRINSSSVNTIRIMTFERNGDIYVLSSVLRMGVDGSRVDNASSGGIVSGIKEDGTLRNMAVNCKGEVYYKHPTSGVEFDGYKVPSFLECKLLAKKLARRFVSASRLISWDFAVGVDGEPILVEMNISAGEIDFHQMCNGPIFGDKLEAVLREVVSDSTTLRYLLEAKF